MSKGNVRRSDNKETVILSRKLKDLEKQVEKLRKRSRSVSVTRHSPRRKSVVHEKCSKTAKKFSSASRRRCRRISSDSSSADRASPAMKRHRMLSPENGSSDRDTRSCTSLEGRHSSTSSSSLVSYHESLSDRDEPSATVEAASEEGPLGDEVIAAENQLSDEVLSLLGKSGTKISKEGEPLQEKLSEIWTSILQTGISEKERSDLMSNFPIPENCPLLEPPKLNPLIQKAVSEATTKRDIKFSAFQNQLGAGIVAIGVAITNILKEKRGEQNVTLLKPLGEAGRLLADLFHQESCLRRELSAFTLKQELKEEILKSPIDQWLFGQDLQARIDNHKSMSRSSLDLKE